jgi:polyhydroxyalkanoate depolymerase
MDLPAEYYLQTLETVFIGHLLPRGLMRHRGSSVNLKAIRRCALMTVEGEKDDITGCGQTVAALELTPNLPARKKEEYVQAGVGHYGVFNGSRFRTEIAPRIKAFMARHAAAEPTAWHRQPGVILLEQERVSRARAFS